MNENKIDVNRLLDEINKMPAFHPENFPDDNSEEIDEYGKSLQEISRKLVAHYDGRLEFIRYNGLPSYLSGLVPIQAYGIIDDYMFYYRHRGYRMSITLFSHDSKEENSEGKISTRSIGQFSHVDYGDKKSYEEKIIDLMDEAIDTISSDFYVKW